MKKKCIYLLLNTVKYNEQHSLFKHAWTYELKKKKFADPLYPYYRILYTISACEVLKCCGI